MFPKIIISVILAFTVFSCLPNNTDEKTVKIDGNYTEIKLFNNSEKHIYALYFEINPKINHNIEIDWGDGGSFSDKITLENNRKYSYRGDYYADEIIIRIWPNENDSGKLYLKSKFYY